MGVKINMFLKTLKTWKKNHMYYLTKRCTDFFFNKQNEMLPVAHILLQSAPSIHRPLKTIFDFNKLCLKLYSINLSRSQQSYNNSLNDFNKI